MTTETAAWEMRVAGQNFMAFNIEHKPECSGMDIDGEVSVRLRCRECDGVAATNPDALDARADLAEALDRVAEHKGAEAIALERAEALRREVRDLKWHIRRNVNKLKRGEIEAAIASLEALARHSERGDVS